MVKIIVLENMNKWWKDKKWTDKDPDLRILSNSKIPYLPRKFFDSKPIEFYPKGTTPLHEPSERDLKGRRLLLLGPRRSGKTMYIKESIKRQIIKGTDPREILFINCDFLEKKTAKELKKYLKAFLEGDVFSFIEKKYIFIDEITSVERWADAIKSLIDEGIVNDVGLMLTGSNPKELKEETKKISGRRFEMHYFFTYTFRDFLKCFSKQKIGAWVPEDLITAAKETTKNEITLDKIDFGVISEIAPKYTPELDKLLQMYMKTGGYPKLIDAYLKNLPENEMIPTEAYHELMYALNADEERFRRIISTVVKSLPNETSYNNIGKNADVSKQTAETHITELENILLVNVLELQGYERLIKVYPSDPAVYYYFTAYSKGEENIFEIVDETMKNEKIGIVAELIVANALRAHIDDPIFRTFRKKVKSAKDVDFITPKRKKRSKLGDKPPYISVEAWEWCDVVGKGKNEELKILLVGK